MGCIKWPRIGLITTALASCAASAWAQLPNEPATVEMLPQQPGPHWLWVNDIAFFNFADGKAVLVDGDAGKPLGMLSTGVGFNGVVIPSKADVIYSPETYYSRGTRGTRTDVVTIYDAAGLRPVAEIEIPPKRSSNMPMVSAAALTDDDRFLLIYNFTPAQSVTVVDARGRKFAGEIETAGCALVYPTGARSFFSICGDGSLLAVTLNEAGGLAGSTRTAELFDGMKDPLTEKGVRSGDTWLFASFEGTIYPIQSRAQGIQLAEKWSLFSSPERAGRWRTGGLQHLALHRGSNRLYALVHQGGPETHKDPGTEIWVYDLASRRKVQQISVHNKTGSIQVSQDSKPLLYTSFIESNVLDIYDASSGQYLRSIDSIAQSPTILVTP